MTATISKATDRVAVLDQELNQIFEGAYITKVSITEESKVMSHPVETGATIEDEIVFQPITIGLDVTLNPNNYRSIYQEIKQVYTTRALLTIQTKSDSYTSMVIEKMPHDEEPNVFDTINIRLLLKEVKFTEAQYETFKLTKVKKPANSSKQKKTDQPTVCKPIDIKNMSDDEVYEIVGAERLEKIHKERTIQKGGGNAKT